jgi:hypothetical protein
VKLGEALAELHRPARIDWKAKFGFSSASLETKTSANKVVASIDGLAEYVPRWGEDWFVLKAEPTDVTKKRIKAAGYRPKHENGEWIWRLKV